ncbi:hypothetical protein [Halomonas halocynthiae]|uniref:hypothetical protein n=1 Tax=Halomonas halocynthiae TaxID=176290 RepID=UPI000421B71A|nr:hypothetical protein [Halomonas halocynthiae]
MNFNQLLPMLGYIFNIIGIVLCIVGLTIAREPHRRILGSVLVVLGFLVAASPMLMQIIGIFAPSASGLLPPQ